MNNWKKYKLGEICNKVVSGGTPSTTVKEYYENGNILWLRTTEVNFNRIYDTEIKITESGLNNSAAKYIPENCVIVALYGNSAGRVAINKIPLTTNQACCNLSINNEIANYNFIFYYLINKYKHLVQISCGSAQQNLSADLLKKYVIEIPDLSTQTRIANFLSQFDDKIELNRQMNKNLEELANTYFKQHFISNKIKSDNLGELIIEKTENVKNENFECVQILSAVKTGDLINSEEYFTKQVFSQNISKYKKVTLWDFAYNPARINIGSIGMLNRDILGAVSPVYTVFKAKKGYEHFMKLLIKQFFIKRQIENLCFGGVRQVLRFSDLASIQIPIPTETEINEFNRFYLPLFAKIESNKKQNETLASYRDSILPKLMCGKIEI